MRVHTDEASRSSAARLSARAFTFGRDIHLGPSGSLSDTRLLFHEAIHTLQQRPVSPMLPLSTGREDPAFERQAARATAAALIGGTTHIARGAAPAAIQRDKISDIRDKLSYSFTDWAITDSEAMEALAMLGEIPPADLPAALKSLGPKYVTRLLDNLPDAAKTGDLYKRIVQTLGVSGSNEYVKDLLSYGPLDWAITDADTDRVYNIFANMPLAEQENMLTGLEKQGKLGRLIDNSNDGHHRLYLRPWMSSLSKGALTEPQKAIFHRIVDESRSGPVETLILAAEMRFNVTVEKSTLRAPAAVDWTPKSLSATYLALEQLPDAHTRGNKFLEKLGQFDLPAEEIKDASGTVIEKRVVGGVYGEGAKELAINVQDNDVQTTVRHETGHAVDAMISWTSGAEPAKPARGGWTQYMGGTRACATDMVADSNSGIQNDLTQPQRNDVILVMVREMATGRPILEESLKEAIRKLAWFGTLDKGKQSRVLDDLALKALAVAVKSPWFDAEGGGVHLGPHVYEKSYPGRWVRYRHEARSRMIKPYQFRGPEEWFAVAYETYYTPDERGRGAKLADFDADTKLWFDNNVDKVAPTR